MTDLTRRSFLNGVAAIPFMKWFEKYGGAQATMTRFDAYSPEGKRMLRSYAAAVQQMKTKGDGDPLSWVFQWYTHSVKPVSGQTQPNWKPSEIARVFPSPSPQKALAQEMWSTCMNHDPTSPETNEWFFLPWHRMFVYFFELIVRKASGDSSFTLPYWNYSTTGPEHGVIPPEFRMKDDPLFKWLYVEERNNGTGGTAKVNDGEPIDKNDPGALNLDALKEECYFFMIDTEASGGFCSTLDFPLHGNVHVDTGNTVNMGRVPWAAKDPIFWMHHCNIDRLWASWNKAGRLNSNETQFLNKEFVFVNENSARVTRKVRNFLDIGSLGYTYDSFEPVPPPETPCPTGPDVAAAAPRKHAVTRRGAISLRAEPVRATLEPPPGTAATVSLTTRVSSLRPERRLYLVLKNVYANVPPGVLYHVYLELPSTTAAREANQYKVGVINFFDASDHGSHGGNAARQPSRSYALNITGLAKSLQRRGELTATPIVTIVPFARPVSQATPVIGEISIVER